MGGMEGGLQAIAGGFAQLPGVSTLGGIRVPSTLGETLRRALEDMGIDPRGLAELYDPETGTIAVEYPGYDPFSVPIGELPNVLQAGGSVVGLEPVAEPVVTEPPIEDVTIAEIAGGDTGRPAGGSSGTGGIDTLSALYDLGILRRGQMSWIDDLADLAGAVGNILTAPVGTQGTVLTTMFPGLQQTPYQLPTMPPQPIPTTPARYPPVWDIPGIDIGGQGSVSARGGPFFEGRTKLRTRRILQFTHPETGRIVWYRNMGRPILWSGDRSTVRRWNRNVGPSRRIGVSRRRKR
jgi:hypothetical protein